MLLHDITAESVAWFTEPALQHNAMKTHVWLKQKQIMMDYLTQADLEPLQTDFHTLWKLMETSEWLGDGKTHSKIRNTMICFGKWLKGIWLNLDAGLVQEVTEPSQEIQYIPCNNTTCHLYTLNKQDIICYLVSFRVLVRRFF